MKTKGIHRVQCTEVKVLTDPALWDTAREMLEDMVMALVVTGATGRLDMEVRTATGFREHWPTVTNSVLATRLIRMEVCRSIPAATFTRKRCIYFEGDEYFFTILLSIYK